MDEKPIEKRYGTLRAIAEVLTFLGSAAALIGPVGIVAGLFVMGGDAKGLLVAAAGGIALVVGLLMLASGESMNVQLDTEHNTRQAALATAMMLADLHELKDLVSHIDASARRTATAVEALAATVRR